MGVRPSLQICWKTKVFIDKRGNTRAHTSSVAPVSMNMKLLQFPGSDHQLPPSWRDPRAMRSFRNYAFVRDKNCKDLNYPLARGYNFFYEKLDIGFVKYYFLGWVNVFCCQILTKKM